MSLTPEMNAIFEEAAANEEYPLRVGMRVFLKELQGTSQEANGKPSQLFHTRRRRLRAAMTRAYFNMCVDSTLGYDTQLTLLRHLLVAINEIDNGKKGGVL